MTDKSDWQGKTGVAWAQEWRRTDRSFSHLTEQLLAKTRGFAFNRVLDIGCGAGELSFAIARGRPEVSVTGVDVSADLIAAAEERGSHRASVSFQVADASDWQCAPEAAPELLVSRHGVMFFNNPPTAFSNLSDQAAHGAGLLFSCFQAQEKNPIFTEILRLLPEAPQAADPGAPGPFAFANPAHVESILTRGGWHQVQMTPVDFPMIAGAGENAVEDAVAYFSRIGPAARAMAEFDSEARERFLQRVRTLAERYCHSNIVALPAAAWIVTARKV